MTYRLDFAIGPVQGFVAQSRRTKDLWSSSYILSYLAGRALYGAEKKSNKIEVLIPLVDNDPLYNSIKMASNNEEISSPPELGSIPNHIALKVPDEKTAKEIAKAMEQELLDAWFKICGEIYKRFIENNTEHGKNTEEIWNRQINNFWEIVWIAGEAEGGELYARRKHWRNHRFEVEPGDKCSVMPELQELSGYIRAKKRNEQDNFWSNIRNTNRVGNLNLSEGERLSAIAFIKRMFPEVAYDAIGWKVDSQRWHSTVFMAARKWVSNVVKTRTDETAKYAENISNHFNDYKSGRNLIVPEKEYAKTADFQRMDANYYYIDHLKNITKPGGKKEIDGQSRDALVKLLKDVYKDPKDKSRTIEPPKFYALLLADGDKLGRLVSSIGGANVGKALSGFSTQAPGIIKDYFGQTIYAGGDDIMAMLPSDGALECAAEISELYHREFDSHKEATLSVSIVFAHIHTKLTTVIESSHLLLETIAKDLNGRNSLAVGVYKPGGFHCRWVSSWERPGSDNEKSVNAVEKLSELISVLRKVDDRSVSSSLIYRLRQKLSTLLNTGEWKPGDRIGPITFELEPYLRADLYQSLEHSDKKKRTDLEKQTEAKEMAKLLSSLMMEIKNIENKETGERIPEISNEVILFDALLLARFLANNEDSEGRAQ